MEAMRDDAGYVLRRDEGKRLTFPRSQITYKVTGQQSGGLLTINEASYAGPAEIALHTHPGVPEAFFVLEGSFTFYIADQRIEAAPGDLVFAPAGLPHGYRVGPQGGRLLTVWAPADLEGFFEELHRSRANGGLTADERRDLAAKYGMHLLGPLPDD